MGFYLFVSLVVIINGVFFLCIFLRARRKTSITARDWLANEGFSTSRELIKEVDMYLFQAHLEKYKGFPHQRSDGNYLYTTKEIDDSGYGVRELVWNWCLLKKRAADEEKGEKEKKI